MKNIPLVCVGVPVFKSEATLPRLLESLVLQSFDSFEVVVVDDGSPWRTGQGESCKKIVKEFSKKARRLRKNICFSLVTHSKNLGLVEARRSVVLNANAPYVFFADSDDLLPENSLEVLYRTALENGADIVHGRAEIYNEEELLMQFECVRDCKGERSENKRHDGGVCSEPRLDGAALKSPAARNEVSCRTPAEDFIKSRRQKISLVHLGVLEGGKIFESYFIKREHSGFLWAKLFRREVLLEAFQMIPRVFCVMAEDMLCYFFITRSSKRYFGIEDSVYLYDMSGGITSRRKITTEDDWMRVCSVSSVFTVLYAFAKENGLEDEAVRRLRKLCLYYVGNNLLQFEEAVVPEMKERAKQLLFEWWGKNLVLEVEKKRAEEAARKSEAQESSQAQATCKTTVQESCKTQEACKSKTQEVCKTEESNLA